MTYATRQDMIDRFGETEIRQLTDKRDPPAGAIDDTVLNRALADADADINAALNGRYTLPLTSTPAILSRVGCNLARYYLYGNGASDEVRTRYEDEMKLLADVAAGKKTIGVDGAGASVAPSSGTVSFNQSRSVFSDDTDGNREFG